MKFGLTTVVFILFCAWVAIGNGPEQRIERTCKPTLWVGNVIVSLTQMITPASQDAVQNTFDKIDYACRYSVWRLFYETDFLKQQQEDEGQIFNVAP